MGAAAAQMKSCVHIIGVTGSGHCCRRPRSPACARLPRGCARPCSTGSDSGWKDIHALIYSPAAARGTLVERHPRLVRQLRQTQAKLDARAIEIVRSDAMQFLTACAPQRFDIVFVDPPFNSALIERVLPLCRARARPEGVIY